MNKIWTKLGIIGGILVVLIAIIAVAYPQAASRRARLSAEEILSAKYSVNTVKSNSFGSLNNVTPASGGRGAGPTSGGSQQSTGQDLAIPASPASPASPAKPAPTGVPEITIAPPDRGDGTMPFIPEIYEFTYSGTELQPQPAEQPVMRRLKNDNTAGGADQLVRALTLGLVDLNSFRQLRLQSFTLMEDQDMGYIVSVDLAQATASIYQNWERWPQPLAGCRDQACFDLHRVQMSDLPDNETTLRLVAEFLASHGINTQAYGTPIVNDDWRMELARSTDQSRFYIPDVVSVIYPLQLEGQTVLDEGGNPTGMYISLDARTRRVTSVSELNSQRYEKSSYAGETDTKRLMDIALRGGWRSYYPMADSGSSSQRVITVELGTPSQSLIRVWQYNGNNSQELYVPALIFPVVKTNSDQTYGPKRVVVPLVKDVLNAQDPPFHILEKPGH